MTQPELILRLVEMLLEEKTKNLEQLRVEENKKNED